MGNQDKENEQVETPDTPAFQDEFTREFMKSGKEVEEGYYEFESATGGYTMLFPVNGTMYKLPYYKEDGIDEIEYTVFNFGKNDDNILTKVDTQYDARELSDDIEGEIRLLSKDVGYEGEYEELKSDGKTIYYAKDEDHVQVEEKEGTFYSFFGYVKSNEDHQGMHFIYEVSCRNFEKPCDIDLDFEEERAKKLMKAVKFHQKADGSE